MQIRNLSPTDFFPIQNVVDEWWGGRSMRDSIPRLFFNHFANTSFVVEEEGVLLGFLIGFLSPSKADEAYIHFVGVNPAARQQGIGRLLYQRFFEIARQNNRTTVCCITSPVNKLSVAFHKAMGFSLHPGDAQEDGIPYCLDYDGLGKHRVVFVKEI